MTNASSAIPMTVEAARAVLWPFREFKGQAIGTLLDNGSIALKDLGFAIERAYDKRVRDASKTLLLHSLAESQHQGITPVGPLNVVASDLRSFAEYRQIQWTMLLGLILGLPLGAALWIIVQAIFREPTPRPQSEYTLAEILSTPVGLIVFTIMILMVIGIYALVIWLLKWITNRIEYQIKLHRKGQRGEERVLENMYHSLDGNWWLFRNIELPGRQSGDIDFVLVGPIGVWVIEVKAYSGEYRVIGDTWQRRLGRNWLPAFTNPSRQAKRNAATLSHALNNHTIKQWITPVIIWANPDCKLTIENPSVHIWHLYQARDELKNLQGTRPLSDEQFQKIIEIFKGFCPQS